MEEENSVTVTEKTEKKKRGRPVGVKPPACGRQRQQLYVARRNKEAMEAIGCEKDATSAILADLLRKAVRQGDESTVKRILTEFCRRYNFP